MTGRVLDISKFIQPDRRGVQIANTWITWDMLRQNKKDAWQEVRKYVYATDTRTTTNSKLPWKNTTTIPKICQIRDNLNSNYLATMFPKRKNIVWQADNMDSNTRAKRDAITNYMCYVLGQKRFKNEFKKLVMDYIDYGNAFAMVDWVDERVEVEDEGKLQVGYVGPVVKRFSPLDVVMNPIAENFENSPVIVRSLISMGEVKDLLEKLSTPDTKEAYQELYDYLKSYRNTVKSYTGDVSIKDEYLRVDGFTDYRQYLGSNYCEILTFYGDLYDEETDTLLKNHVVVIADRHKELSCKPNPSFFGKPNIYHVGWRPRQDNLWAMGPLDNLIGMQYRLDHLENLKADIWDQIAFPLVKIKGMVDDFEWGPFARVYTSEEGDVELMHPDATVLQTGSEMAQLMSLMEEMAGSPKEAMGFRTPGEKTKYEVQRLENAASRIFQNKISQFEEQFVEEILNGMLELAKRKVTGNMLISVMDEEFKIQTFLNLTSEDITGQGRVKPIAARHFAEQAETLQNITQFYQSGVGQDPAIQQHISGIGLAKIIFDELLDLKDYSLVQPYIRIAEQADAQRQVNALQEQVSTEAATATGINGDYDKELDQQMPANMMGNIRGMMNGQ